MIELDDLERQQRQIFRLLEASTKVSERRLLEVQFRRVTKQINAMTSASPAPETSA